MVSFVFIDNLIELLLGLIVTFNIAAYTLVWRKIKDIGKETQKNSETLNTVLHRIFGIEQDPTDDGHIMETEKKIDDIKNKLDEISEKQDNERKERIKEHKKVDEKISSIVSILKEKEVIKENKSGFR